MWPMMRLLLSVFTLVFFTQLHAQRPLYYFTGLPADYTYGNALRTIADQWKIEVKYAGYDVIEQYGYEQLEKYNDSVSSRIAVQTGIGESWRDSFFLLVRLEDQRQDSIRMKLMQHRETELQALSMNELLEPFVLMERKRSMRYTCYLVGQKRGADDLSFRVLAAWKYSDRRNNFRRVRKPSPVLPFTIPENGIL
jgi:hypothetical protein